MALVALLRGVNVGGYRTFRPSTFCNQLKHLDAVNIGAAGTFVIRKEITRVRTDTVRFVSILSKRPRSEPSMPLSLPSSGRWLLRILGRKGRFVFGLYRRHMKVIGYLGSVDQLFGVSATTRNWNTIGTIAEMLG